MGAWWLGLVSGDGGGKNEDGPRGQCRASAGAHGLNDDGAHPMAGA
jgi:hypothetical protein